MDHVAEFLSFCAARGFRPANANFEPNGKMVNFLRDGEKRYSKYRGSMKVFDDGGAAGWIYDFSAGENIEEWHTHGRETVSAEELKEAARRRAAVRAAEEKRLAAKRVRFTRRLTKLWGSMPSGDRNHAYATKKGVDLGSAKMRRKWGEMLIPLENIYGYVTTLQRITAKGDAKLLLPADAGAVLTGSFHWITGFDLSPIIVCEGWATGMSVHRMTGATVACAITAGNMKAVATALKKKYPDAVFVFAADNDASETGWKKSNEAAAEIGGAVVVMPEKVDTDFNDAEKDDESTAKQILMRALDEARIAAQTKQDSVQVSPPDAEGGVDASNVLVGSNYPDDAPPEYLTAAPDIDPSAPPIEDEKTEIDDEEGEYLTQNRREWDRPNGLPFRILGINNDKHYYYSLALSRVVEIGMGGHSMQRLWLLADASEWMLAYGKADKGTVLTPKQTYERAIEDIIRIAKRMPPFKREHLCRPFGAWKEGSTFVFNGGNRIRKGERVYRMNENDSLHVYLSPEEDGCVKVTAKPLEQDTLDWFVDLCGSFKWSNSVMGEMLAGWTFIAPLCNVLPHRPHLFVTGETGAGKSWAIFNSAVRAIENSVLIAKMSEAKLREKTYSGIRPLIMDESSKRDRDDVRIDQIISLARDAATGKGAVIEVSGKAPALVKFCACLIASNPPLKNLEDENRFFFLRIKEDRSPEARKNFEALQNSVASLFFDGFSDRFIMTGFERLPLILENAKVFKAAVQKKHNARAADVIGMMAAGYWAMTRNAVATREEAENYVEERQWDSGSVVESRAEYMDVLDYLLSSKITEHGATTRRDVPVWLLLKSARDGDDLAIKTLGYEGIKLKGNEVLFGSGRGLSDILRGTKWQTSYRHFLLNVPGARKFRSERVNSKDRTSGIAVPLSACIEIEDEVLF